MQHKHNQDGYVLLNPILCMIMKKMTLCIALLLCSLQAKAQQFASPSLPIQFEPYKPYEKLIDIHNDWRKTSELKKVVAPISSTIGVKGTTKNMSEITKVSSYLEEIGSEMFPFMPTKMEVIRLPNYKIQITYFIECFVMANITVWIDPVLAIGYNYFIDKGPDVVSIQLPKGIGDNKYDLWLFDEESKDFKDSGIDIVGGKSYKFEKPVRQFSIRGIETSAGLNPEDGMAFPSGLAFSASSDEVQVRMIPISVDTDK